MSSDPVNDTPFPYISQERYDNIWAERNQLREQVTALETELAALRELWVPVSERLPEGGHYVQLMIHAYLDRKYWWLPAEGVHVLALPERFGVAWRPLPELLKEGGE